MAARDLALAGLGDGCGETDPATEPETHGDDLDEGNHDFMRETREPERREAEVGDGDQSGPAAVEEHVVDQTREGP